MFFFRRNAKGVYSILADEEVRQGLKVWVSHEQNNVGVTTDLW